MIKITILMIVLMALKQDSVIHVGQFSSADISLEHPEGWKPMTFTGLRATQYKLVQKDIGTAVKAESNRSSSGLVARTEIDLKSYPVMRWTWRVENIYKAGDVTQKSGDDYPARIYVIFDYGLENLSWGQRNLIRVLRFVYGEVPSRAINYIYESRAEVGTIIPNPYSDLVTMVVVDSGEDNVGKWVSYERNVYVDYINIFGEEPPKIAAIAIMTDSDDTKESAVSYFGDITFHKN